MAQILPLSSNATVAVTPFRKQHNYTQLIDSATTLPRLKQIHALVLKHDYQHHLFDLLLSSLSIPSSTSYSLSLLSVLPPPSPRLSNKLIKHLSLSNSPHYTLLYFQFMHEKSFPIDRFTFPPLLKAAAKSTAICEGRTVHGLVSKMGFDCVPFVATALIAMYGSCGHISEARVVFDKMSYRDIVTWNIMIDGYCKADLFDKAIALLEEMNYSDTKPDEKIYATVLSACGRVGNLEVGKAIHGFLSDHKIVIDSYLQSALLNMYAGCGMMDVAQSLYDKLKPMNVVASTAMISGYSKAGNIEAARLIFDKIDDNDRVSWSAMLSGYAENDQPQEALKLFHDMQQSGTKPDQITMLSVVSACARLGALERAKQIHLFIKNTGFGQAVPVNNALIDMYAKCGSLSGAKEVFDHMSRKNVISWTSMINAFAIHGDADNALKYFGKMKLENVQPNWVTFVGVLYACSHAGLVDEGRKIFDSMLNEYRIPAKLEHYGCMVDLYGRANQLRDALELVERMPMAPNVVIWGSLMASCRIHGEFELGEFAAKRVIELDPDHDGAHVFLSNVYAKGRRWDNVGVVRQTMKQQGILKERGFSMVEMDDEIHEFLTADKSHKHTDEIYAKLDEVVDKIQRLGYTPNTSSVMVDLDEDEKREAVLLHSEKLALCYGLIGGEKKSCIRIIKNLRICEDCHNFMKLVSKAFDKEIVVRDRTRFHHCNNGLCSCKDYW